MKKTISILIIAMMCCLLFCGCDSAVEGDEPGIAIINDCVVKIENGFSTEFCTFNGRPGRMATIWVDMENNSDKPLSIGDIAVVKVFINGREVRFMGEGIHNDILPGSQMSYKYTSSESVTSDELLVQIQVGSKVITEKELFDN